MKCVLCEKETANSKHHLIPKAIMREIPNAQKFASFTINVCWTCHEKLHQHFITHLVIMGKIDGIDKFDGIRYQIMQKYIRGKYNSVWKDYHKFYTEFLDKSLKTLCEGEKDGNSENQGNNNQH